MTVILGVIPKLLFLGRQRNVADEILHWRLESASGSVVIFDHSCELRLKLNRRSPDAESCFGCCAVFALLCACSILLIPTPTKHSH